jgi:tripartite-type tricarboxylate transporter receptor subunit TctC
MRVAIVAAVAAALVSAGAYAQDKNQDKVAAFYKGKTISVYIGSDVGGGYNAFARTVWRYLPEYLPGKPNAIFLNMPGAGGRKATAYMAAVAAKDGSAVGAVQPGAIVESVLGDPKNVRYDPLTFGYVGSPESSDQLCLASRNAPVKKFEDVFTHELIVGGDAKGSSLSDYANLMKNVLGAKFKVVNGYKGSHEVVMAIERGELQGMCGYGWSPLMSQAPHLVKENKVNLLVQFTLPDHAYPEPTKMGVPLIWKFVKTEEQRKMLELAAAPLVFGRPEFVPGGVPKERLMALRRAFDKTMKDPRYIKDAEKQHLGVTPASGEEVEEMVRRIFSAPKALAAKTRAALYNEPVKK